MTNSAIFGKKGSIAKIDTDSLEALWVSNLSKNYKPTNISNYKNFILGKEHVRPASQHLLFGVYF